MIAPYPYNPRTDIDAVDAYFDVRLDEAKAGAHDGATVTQNTIDVMREVYRHLGWFQTTKKDTLQIWNDSGDGTLSLYYTNMFDRKISIDVGDEGEMVLAIDGEVFGFHADAESVKNLAEVMSRKDGPCPR